MTAGCEEACAGSILRLLLDVAADPGTLSDREWAFWLGLAKRNLVLIRTADRLSERGVQLPDVFAEAVVRERQRIHQAVKLAREISQVSSRNNVPFVFKAFHDFPDMGHDVDLFVPRGSWSVDELLERDLHAKAEKSGLVSRIAGTTGYVVNGYVSPVEIYHGRIGRVGEHSAYFDVLLRRRSTITIDGTAFYIPAPEDQLLIRMIQCLCVRQNIRLSDILSAIRALVGGNLDWNGLIKTCRRTGLFGGLCCYLSCAEQIYAQLFGAELLPRPLRKTLTVGRWGQVKFRNGCYGFHGTWAIRKLYAQTFWAAVALGNWDCAGRLCLVPLVVAVGAARRVTNLGLGRLQRNGSVLGIVGRGSVTVQPKR